MFKLLPLKISNIPGQEVPGIWSREACFRRSSSTSTRHYLSRYSWVRSSQAEDFGELFSYGAKFVSGLLTRMMLMILQVMRVVVAV